MVEVDNLVKQYEDFSLNISLNIPGGVITGIIGKNGAGKSTLIKSILGLINPTSGNVKVFGKDVSKLTTSDKCDIGVAMAEAGFSMYLTVKDVAGILKKMYPSFQTDFFADKCKQLGLPMNKLIKEFSTGMKAKLRVLVAISHEAKLLILDEPTAGLDIEARNEILAMLREYMAKDDSRSIMISSHISSDLEGLCDDIYLIHDGRLLLHEEIDNIMSNYALVKVNKNDYETIDKTYFLATKQENFGYVCLTNQKRYYLENYPKVVVENGNIDELILMMTGGK
ncbi:MAG: ABC transporter ATP-binding protein [Agathobacter sp.]|nr:ABC transporter ATP-binding protein [Agathobacter sp.]